MKAKQHLKLSMQEEQIRDALNAHWRASAAGDVNAEQDIYDDDAICDYPQSGERILGRSNLQAVLFARRRLAQLDHIRPGRSPPGRQSRLTTRIVYGPLATLLAGLRPPFGTVSLSNVQRVLFRRGCARGQSCRGTSLA